MPFHIILGPYQQRTVPCHQTGRFHRHKTHIEKYCLALCGVEVVKGRHGFCNLSLADPTMQKPWCKGCVESAPWTPGGVEPWKAKGFFQES